MKISNKNGFVTFHKENNEYVIDMIKSIKKGNGSKLIKNVEKYVSKRNCKTISLFAEPQDHTISKENLFNFYRKNGYKDNECAGLFYKNV